MNAKHQKSQIHELRKQEHVEKVLQILRESKSGLTSFEIAVRAGDRLPRTILTELQKEGRIRQKRGMTSNGRLAFLYVLNKAAKP